MMMTEPLLCPLKIHIIMRQTLNLVQIFKLLRAQRIFISTT
jgi:hypothetical protein